MEPNDAFENSGTHHLVAILLASAVATFLVAHVVAFETEFRYATASPVLKAADVYTKLTIDFGDGTKRAFRGRTETGMTAMVALRAAQTTGGFKVETDDRGVVVAIGDTRADGVKGWHIYQNGALAKEVLGRVVVAPGDSLELRFE